MKPIVIIGAVAAGMSAASQLKRQMPDLQVIVYGKEPYISYGACGMPYYVSGEIKDYNKLIVLKPEKAINERNIDLKVEHEVIKIDKENKKVTVKDLKSGNTFEQEYEKLVIATGARGVKPPIEGIDLKGVFPLIELDDSIELTSYLDSEKPKKAVIVGGGFIGVEVAEAFSKRGMDVTLIQAAPSILRTMDVDMSSLVLEEMKRNEVEVLLNAKVTAFKGKEKIEKVILEDGKEIKADVVLISIGVSPNSELAKEAGLELGEKNAVKNNLYLQTSDADIYAAGDCSTVYNALLDKYVFVPLALGANRQGRMCGENIAALLKGERPKPFPGIIGTSMTKVFDYEIGKTGIGEVEIERYGLEHVDSVQIKYVAQAGYYPNRSKIWVKLFFESDTKRIVGGQIVGQAGSVLRIDVLVAAISSDMRLDELYNLDLGYCPPFSPVWDPLLVAAKAALSK